MNDSGYIYIIEKWNDKAREWVPAHCGTDDLEEMGELLCLMEVALPDREFKLAQYNVAEYKEVHEYS